MFNVRRQTTFWLCCVTALFILIARAPSFAANAGSIKGTVSATTGGTNVHFTLISGARLALINPELPGQIINTVTDDAGNFNFPNLPAAKYLLTVDASGLSSFTREINLAAGATLTIEVILTATLSESVTVRDEEGLLSTAETSTSNTIRSQTLRDLPLRAENYQSALLLTPGVVRDRDGLDHIKGARAGQSAYTVNGADITDPVTGNVAFDIPLEAIAGVQIEENPYSAEFGRLTGGATSLETKGGGDTFRFTATRFLPTFRNLISGPLDSFRPRLTLSGPVVRNRLFFLQSFEYRFSRSRVPSLVAPRDSSTLQAFNSFTQLDLTVNKFNRLKLFAAFFPQKRRYANLNTFNSQETTPDIKQRGSLFSVSEQAIFGDGSFLTSELSYKTFSVDVFPQGAQSLTLLPDGNTGNYFAETRRRAPRLQWQETYYVRPFEFGGQHSLKIGTEFARTNVSGQFGYRPILIRRQAGTLAERINFTDAAAVPTRATNEVGVFLQDHWVVNNKLTIDAGLRFDRDGLVRANNFAPRLSFLYLPLKNERTIIRGGVGLFYDRTPLGIGYFTQLPKRVVTTFAADGISVTDMRRFDNVIENRLYSPRSVRWSLQLDRGITQNLTARVGYLERSTRNDFIIEPRQETADTAALVLGSRGRSRYRELQLIAAYNNSRFGNWNAAYVFSRARGDLNTVDNFLGDLPSFVVRPNEYAPLPFDAPHRFLLYGQLNTRHDIVLSPSIEVRSGYPFSLVDEGLTFIGARNQAGRLPIFLSLDVQVIKGFIIPKFVPKFDGRRARIGVAVFNITNHFNPRDVQNNVGSPRVGEFFNSLGTSVRGKFELDL